MTFRSCNWRPLLALIASVAFTTIIAVTSGLAISAAASFTRDIHANMARRKPPDEALEIATARRTVMVVLCLLQTVASAMLMSQSIAFLLSLDITIVASSMLPALLPNADFALFPWKSVGLVSIPLGFLLGDAGARRSPERDDAKYAEMEVRALTGAGDVAALALDNRRECHRLDRAVKRRIENADSVPSARDRDRKTMDRWTR